MKVPEKFAERMKELLQEEYTDFAESYNASYNTGLRVNQLKLAPEEFEKNSPFSIEPVPWTENGFYYRETEQPAKHPFYYAGLYYIQEPSAMSPAALLPVAEGDKILDMCGAPGGKSTELAAKLQGTGLLVTNDISNSRAKALLKNIELFGVKNAIVMSEDPKKLVDYFEGYFDKILIDAPCSGEGMFRKEPAMIKNWEEQDNSYYSKIQKEIILYGAKMLKANGTMVYSTCTFSPEENEGTITYLLDNCPEFTVEKIECYSKFSKGRPDWILKGREELAHCIRLWPHKIKGEGHFVALLRKNQGHLVEHNKYGFSDFIMPEGMEVFIKDINIEFDMHYFQQIEDKIYYLPKGIVNMKGLRILRSGLLLGTVKKNRFEPSQALAVALKMEEYNRVINLTIADVNVVKYLKGETIEIEGEYMEGWNLICVAGYPLGWGKLQGTALKNKYYPGWRWL